MSFKATPSADSIYSGYFTAALNDGVQTYAGKDFQRRGMATEDAPGPHWVQVTFPAERDASRVVIYWNAEGGRVYSSRLFEVQVLVGDDWVTVAEGAEPEPTLVSVLEFDTVATTAVRVRQPDGMGPAARPNIMWVAEVEVH